MVHCPIFLNKSSEASAKGTKSGISITELLIVVAVIAILMVILLAAFKPSTQFAKARDARRKADLQKLKNPLEDYYNDKKCYPDALSKLVPDYIGAEPKDPNTGEFYQYSSEGCDKYRIYAELEFKSDQQIAQVGCSAGCGPVSETGQDCSYNYGVCSSNVGLERCGGEEEEECSGIWWGCQGNECNAYGSRPTCVGGGIPYCADSSCGGGCTPAKCCTDCGGL